jgi:hypothetical protein
MGHFFTKLLAVEEIMRNLDCGLSASLGATNIVELEASDPWNNFGTLEEKDWRLERP